MDAFQSHPVPSVLVNLSGHVTAINEAARRSPFARALLRDADDVDGAVGTHGSDALTPEAGQAFARWFEAAVELPSGTRLTVSQVSPGQPYWVRVARLEQGILFTVDHIDGLLSAESTAPTFLGFGWGADFLSFQKRYPYGSVASFDADHRYLSVAGQGWAELEIDPGVLVGRRFSDLWPAETADHLAELADIGLSGHEASARVEYIGRTFEVWVGPLPDRQEGRRGLFLSRDVTDQLRSERTRTLLAEAIDIAPVGVSVARISDAGFPLEYVNHGFTAITGYPREEILGRDCKLLQGEYTAEHDKSAIRQALHARQPIIRTLLNYRKDGTHFWNRLTLAPVALEGAGVSHYIGIQEDVSERRADGLERERLERVAHVGALASEVAHDFNNLLMQVSGWLELTEGSPNEALRGEARAAIADAISRGRDLTADMLRRSRREPTHALEVDVATDTSAITRLLEPIHRRLGPETSLHVDVAARGARLRIAELRLEQVLVNLVANSADAISGEGKIRVFCGLSGRQGYGFIQVSDNGSGMSEGVRNRVFERFFSTKGSQGTGLGLSSALRIVRECNGTIDCRSTEGEGSTFTVELPLAGEPPEPAGTLGEP